MPRPHDLHPVARAVVRHALRKASFFDSLGHPWGGWGDREALAATQAVFDGLGFGTWTDRRLLSEAATAVELSADSLLPEDRPLRWRVAVRALFEDDPRLRRDHLLAPDGLQDQLRRLVARDGVHRAAVWVLCSSGSAPAPSDAQRFGFLEAVELVHLDPGLQVFGPVSADVGAVCATDAACRFVHAVVLSAG